MSIQSVHRALGIMELFTPARPELSLTELSAAMNLPKTTVHNLARTLAQHGFLDQDPQTKKYRLGLKIYELGVTLAGGLKINQLGAAAAERLTAATGLMSRLALWDQDAILVTLNIFPQNNAPRIPNLGPRTPAYCTALGKAILAWLPNNVLEDYLSRIRPISFTAKTTTGKKQLKEDLEKTRTRGYAVDRAEYMQGMYCVGSPIFDYRGFPIGAISVSSMSETILDDSEEQVQLELMRASMEISGYFGYTPGAAIITPERI